MVKYKLTLNCLKILNICEFLKMDFRSNQKIKIHVYSPVLHSHTVYL